MMICNHLLPLIKKGGNTIFPSVYIASFTFVTTYHLKVIKVYKEKKELIKYRELGTKYLGGYGYKCS